MRNGNDSTSTIEKTAPPSSYRTYEEWKPLHTWWDPPTFFSSYRTYEEWKLTKRKRMRHTIMHRSYRTYEEWKPLLNLFFSTPLVSSYRTYEEWKPTKIIFLSTYIFSFLPYLWGMETYLILRSIIPTTRSYRTYEEWKLMIVVGVATWLKSSYRTYEEWKLPSGSFVKMISCGFLPYLWGMETKKVQYWGLGEWVLTVPMRNGNNKDHLFIDNSLSSYRTYEEWKQVKRIQIKKRALLFLPYLWGMETYFHRHSLWNLDRVLTVPMRNGNWKLVCANASLE